MQLLFWHTNWGPYKKNTLIVLLINFTYTEWDKYVAVEKAHMLYTEN